MDSLNQYIKDTKAELKHVTWPTQTQTINFTVAVVVISVVTSFYLAFFDGVFLMLLQKFLNF
ncbi:MAG: preprotein translocase subunit SecE [bacterium]